MEKDVLKKICGAKTRQGEPCKKTPLKNGRCRFHGSKSTGPKNREKHRQSLQGNKNALVTENMKQFLSILCWQKKRYFMKKYQRKFIVK